MTKLVISGFPDEASARSWWDWYEGQGEQDVSLWIEASAYATLSEPEVVGDEVRVELEWKNTDNSY